MNVVAYKLLPESSLEWIRMQLVQTLDRWQADWGVSLPVDIDYCRRAWEVDQRDSRFQVEFQDSDFQNDHRPAKYLHRRLSPGFSKRLPLFSDDCSEVLAEGKKPGGGEIVAKLAAQATQALLDTLDELLGGNDERERTRSPFRHGSGWVAIKISVGRETLSLLAQPASVRQIQEAQAPVGTTLSPVDLRRAFASADCRARAIVGEAQVDIASLATLAVGDVIALEQPIAIPLKVLGESDELLFHAHIGTSEGQLALRLFPL